MENTKKEELIGFHKGAISVLAIEQQEFGKIMSAVQQQIQAHVKALKELGVDLEAEYKKIQEKNKEDLDKRLK
jgi:tagatose-1,6-bisphosphate aldolase